jgi:hypothetical protein
MQVSFGKNKSYVIESQADAIAISFSESGETFPGGNSPFWQLDIYALTQESRVFVGTVFTVPPPNGTFLSRIIAYAICPGARGWAIEATGPDDDFTGVWQGRVYGELRAHPVCECVAFGITPGVYRIAGRTLVSSGPVLGGQATRTDFTSAIAFTGAQGSNDTAVPLWLMFFDATIVPPDGAQPTDGLSFNLPPSASFSYIAPLNGLFFKNGLTWAASTTPGFLTLYVAAVGAPMPRVTTYATW